MPTRDRRIDAYIAKSAEFARPILTHLRAVVHAGCPEVEETLKWRSPTFMYRGILCGMAAFKQHAVFGFWKRGLIVNDRGQRVDEAMGQFGRLTKLTDLPPKKVLVGYVRAAVKLNEDGVKVSRPTKTAARKPLAVPADLKAALQKNRKAFVTFEGFSTTKRRDYIEWIVEAKREETRAKRLRTTIDWLAQGKSRNWKHENG